MAEPAPRPRLSQIYANHTNIAHKKSPDNDETNPVCHISDYQGTSIPSEPFRLLEEGQAAAIYTSGFSDLTSINK